VDEKLDMKNGFFAQPIGHIQPCFEASQDAAAQGYAHASAVV